MGDIENRKINSIDILEDCLNSIHRCRRNTLVQKIKRHEHGSCTTRNRNVLRLSDETLTQTPVRARVDHRKFVGSTALPQESFEGTLTTQPPTPLVKTDTAQMKGKEHIRNHAAATSLDNKAEEALLSLRNEITMWSAKHKGKVTDDDSRGEYADYLTEKYLCNILDPMPSSATISKVRKQVSMDLESFVSIGPEAVTSSGNTAGASADMTGQPINTPSPLSDAKAVNTVDSKVHKNPNGSGFGDMKGKRTGMKPDLDNSTVSVQHDLTQATSLKKIEERKLIEKEKIKNQYEKFRQLKAESEKNASSATVRQAEANVDDIQSLLTALQSKK